ncbi:S1C family serine protease [Salirhabdus salicampi]|uniref:S1C family serine protease n=1 Tax=Salirhabdus salicampi TaxID=476102 RepID=UPI0020C5983C|nr:trypsin-like peptidase domain-containing protein [Salirhabdus salicampi]MCP8617236.1 trypsin-like peptidase domain-containing protein [Salirhabdus salicampi]
MGYYDDHGPKRQERSGKSWIIPSILGLILGIFLVILSLPTLIQANLLPYQFTIDDENNTITQGNGDGTTQSVNVNISTQVTDIVENVSNTVVGVVNIGGSDFWINQRNEAGTGSGVIYKLKGQYAYVVTNHHVVQGASEVEVVLADGSRIEAKLLGSDMFSDLAVLRVSAEEVDQAIDLGSSENVKVGEPVIAIGNPLGLEFAGSVTQGIISGKERVVPQDLNGDGVEDWHAEVIQTDAAINPGNSGGALINMQGQLIGINSMKIAQHAVEGIGFSIPIDVAKPIIDDLEEDGKIARPYMGIEPRSLSEIHSYHWQNTLKLPRSVEGGVVIEMIEPVAPASQGGLKRYDVIVALDGEPVMDVIDLRKHLYTKKNPGDEMTVTYYREGKQGEVSITLSAQEF